MTFYPRGYFNLWYQTVQIMAMRELDGAPCNEGIYFVEDTGTW